MITPEVGYGNIQLDVSVQPSVTVLPELATITVGEEKTILCEITRFYPKLMEVTWLVKKDLAPELPAVSRDVCTGIPVPNGDQTYNVHSRITVLASMEENGAVYVCQIKHRSYGTPHRRNATLKVVAPRLPSDSTAVIAGTFSTSVLLILAVLGAVFIYFRHFQRVPPNVSEIIQPAIIYANETAKLKCNITAFRSHAFKVQWLRVKQHQFLDQAEGLGGSPEAIPLNRCDDVSDKAENQFDKQHGLCVSTIPIQLAVEDDNTEFRCIVRCGRTEISRTAVLKVTVRPSFFQISSLPPIPELQKPLVLCCRMEKFYPGSVSLEWFRDGQAVKDVTQFGPFEDSGQLYSVWSQSQLTVTKEDEGAVYTCCVRHDSFPEPGFREISYELNLQGTAPKVMWIKCDPPQPGTGQECTLNCSVSNFCPDSISVKWQKNDQPIHAGVSNSPPVLNASGLYSLWSFLRFTPEEDDDGSVFKCVVEHSTLSEPEERIHVLNVSK
ncbi:NR3L1 protein, partial [Atractosteus spatula]|nr:NR3L1 protein [Atractosteus spatula]